MINMNTINVLYMRDNYEIIIMTHRSMEYYTSN